MDNENIEKMGYNETKINRTIYHTNVFYEAQYNYKNKGGNTGHLE